jgi:predicted ABC-type ATPase
VRESWRRPPGLSKLLSQAVAGKSKPTAFVLAGHNGSGKTTLWNERLAPQLKIPLINADRITASILPPADAKSGQLPQWARKLRDNDERWQLLSQAGVQAFVGLVMEREMPFAFETVFSHWKKHPDGRIESKADIIKTLRAAGYFVVLLFVGLSAPELSVLRVETRKEQGGHGVPLNKLNSRFPRTQRAIGYAAPIADMTLMFDNSRAPDKAFALVRAQRGKQILFDCRDPQYILDRSLRAVARTWLEKVAGPYQTHTPRAES